MLRYIANPSAARHEAKEQARSRLRVVLTREGCIAEQIAAAEAALDNALADIKGDEYPTGLEYAEAVADVLAHVLAETRA